MRREESYAAVIVDNLIARKGEMSFEEAWEGSVPPRGGLRWGREDPKRQGAIAACGDYLYRTPRPKELEELLEDETPIEFLRRHCERAWNGEGKDLPTGVFQIVED